MSTRGLLQSRETGMLKHGSKESLWKTQGEREGKVEGVNQGGESIRATNRPLKWEGRPREGKEESGRGQGAVWRRKVRGVVG